MYVTFAAKAIKRYDTTSRRIDDIYTGDGEFCRNNKSAIFHCVLWLFFLAIYQTKRDKFKKQCANFFLFMYTQIIF